MAEETYALSDLENWSFDGVPLAVLGHPIKHSISPAMHNAALAAMADRDKKFGAWRYFRFDVHPDDLPQALPRLHKAGFKGLNLTIPHKVEAVELVAAIDPVARLMGAVNTLLWQEDGYHGYNSDGYGLEQALKSELETSLDDAVVILLGAGGAARAAAVQCLQSGCRQLWIGNRNQDRLSALLDSIKGHEQFERVKGFDITAPPGDLPDSGILVNATSLGLKADDPQPVSLDRFATTLKVYDMIYNPPETALLKAARSRGMSVANGLSMLVWQGVRSLEIWSETDVPADVMARAAQDALA